MAGIPLKSGADFYNLEASRMRLHNLGADPTEFGLGQIYYNSSSGNNTSGRARLYTGTGFRSLAFMDDIAAIQEQLDLLTGEVDTSELISNLEDVLNFLNNIKESDGDLMTMLDDKLSKSKGGTMTGLLYIQDADKPRIVFKNNTENVGVVGFINKQLSVYIPADNSWNPILTSAGGTISGGAKVFTIERDDTSLPSVIAFSNKSGYLGYIGFDGNDSPIIYNADLSTKKKLLHSGNIVHTSANFNDAEVWRFFTTTSTENRPSTAGYHFGLTLGTNSNKKQIAFSNRNGAIELFARTSSNETWTDWKTIAFTDSNVDITFANETGVAGTTKEGDKYKMLYLSNANNLLLGYHTSIAGLNTKINGNNIYLNYGINHTTGLLLNSSGNVTIGSQDWAKTDYKFYVNEGKSFFYAWNSANPTLGTLQTNSVAIGDVNNGLSMWYQSGKGSMIQSMKFNEATELDLALNPLGGSVLIGTTTNDNSGAKLQVKGYARALAFLTNGDSGIWKGNVFGGTGNTADSIVIYGDRINHRADTYINGDLHVTGNIIADKEVSAGGAAEESGEGGGGTGGGVEPYVFTFTPSTTTVSVNHNISSEDVIVQVYEKDATSGKWSVVLVDIEIVDSTTVNLHFGRTETTEHKVVIIG